MIPRATPTVTPGQVVGALCAAAALQLAAVAAAFTALAIWFLSVVEGFFGSTAEPMWWGVFALPMVLVAFALWIGSGAVAARIVRRRAGWTAVLMLPVAAALLSALAALV